MATKLVRTYRFTPGKDIHGMGEAVRNFFESYKGTQVILGYNADGSCVIFCITDSFVRKASGNDVQITVTIIPKGDQAEVHYRQDISEALRAVKAVFKSFALTGISELYGIQERREIPIKLNDVINKYLNE